MPSGAAWPLGTPNFLLLNKACLQYYFYYCSDQRSATVCIQQFAWLPVGCSEEWVLRSVTWALLHQESEARQIRPHTLQPVYLPTLWEELAGAPVMTLQSSSLPSLSIKDDLATAYTIKYVLNVQCRTSPHPLENFKEKTILSDWTHDSHGNSAMLPVELTNLLIKLLPQEQFVSSPFSWTFIFVFTFIFLRLKHT